MATRLRHEYYPAAGDRVIVERTTTPTDRFFAQIQRIVWFVIAIGELLLLLRLVFQMIGAIGPFASWLYQVTSGWVAPFQGLIPNLSYGSVTLEFSTLLAMLAGVIIGALIVALLDLLHPVPSIDV